MKELSANILSQVSGGKFCYNGTCIEVKNPGIPQKHFNTIDKNVQNVAAAVLDAFENIQSSGAEKHIEAYFDAAYQAFIKAMM